MSNLTDVFTALTAFSATGAAWMGILTWKSQKKWDESRDLGKRYLKQVHELRAVVLATAGLGDKKRFLQPTSQALFDEKPEGELEFWRGFYSTMSLLEAVNDSLFLLDSLRDEAVGIWGFGVEKWHDSLHRLEGELQTTLKLQLSRENPNGGERHTEKMSQLLAMRRAIRCEFPMDGNADEFLDEFKGAVDQLRLKISNKMK